MKSILLILLPVILTGCVSPQATMRSYTIAGGELIQLPLAAGGALPSQTKNAKIEVTGFMVNDEKAELTYTFGFSALSGRSLKRVVVEDVSGPTAVRLVDDASPVLDSRYWKGFSTPRRAGDETLGWLHAPGNTEKVFRFVITFADGETESIYQASIWRGQSKPIIRKALKI